MTFRNSPQPEQFAQQCIPESYQNHDDFTNSISNGASNACVPTNQKFTHLHRMVERALLLVEAPAPSPCEHESVLENAYCGYAILQIAGLHNVIFLCPVLPLQRALPFLEADLHWLSRSQYLSPQIEASCTSSRPLSYRTTAQNIPVSNSLWSAVL